MSELDAYETPPGYGDMIGKCLTFAEIEALLAAERERCAAVAERRAGEWAMAARGAAARIACEIRELGPALPAPATPQEETP